MCACIYAWDVLYYYRFQNLLDGASGVSQTTAFEVARYEGGPLGALGPR